MGGVILYLCKRITNNNLFMENNHMQRGNMAARNHRAMNKSTLHVRFEISFLNSYDMTMLRENMALQAGELLYS